MCFTVMIKHMNTDKSVHSNQNIFTVMEEAQTVKATVKEILNLTLPEV